MLKVKVKALEKLFHQFAVIYLLMLVTHMFKAGEFRFMEEARKNSHEGFQNDE